MFDCVVSSFFERRFDSEASIHLEASVTKLSFPSSDHRPDSMRCGLWASRTTTFVLSPLSRTHLTTRVVSTSITNKRTTTSHQHRPVTATTASLYHMFGSESPAKEHKMFTVSTMAEIATRADQHSNKSKESSILCCRKSICLVRGRRLTGTMLSI